MVWTWKANIMNDREVGVVIIDGVSFAMLFTVLLIVSMLLFLGV
jgi:hypothetical protein